MAKGKVLQVRLSDAEMALVEKRSEEAGLKPSQWARAVMLGMGDKEMPDWGVAISKKVSGVVADADR